MVEDQGKMTKEEQKRKDDNLIKVWGIRTRAFVLINENFHLWERARLTWNIIHKQSQSWIHYKLENFTESLYDKGRSKMLYMQLLEQRARYWTYRWIDAQHTTSKRKRKALRQEAKRQKIPEPTDCDEYEDKVPALDEEEHDEQEDLPEEHQENQD